MPDGIEFLSNKLVYKKPGKASPTLNEIHVCELHAPGEEPFDLNFKFRRVLYAPGSARY